MINQYKNNKKKYVKLTDKVLVYHDIHFCLDDINYQTLRCYLLNYIIIWRIDLLQFHEQKFRAV